MSDSVSKVPTQPESGIQRSTERRSAEQSETRTWRVRIVLDMPSPLMVLGASVTVSLPGQVSSAFVLPASALTRLYDKPAVFVCDEKNKKVWRREVTLAEYSAASVFVTAGLRPGERVVTAGVSSLRDGQSVSTEGTEP